MTPRMPLKPVGAAGFTLVEVIVAIIIAAVCLTALSQVFATGVRSASISADYSKAVTLAESLLASAGIERALSDGAESGNSPDGTLVWTLQTSTEPSADSDNVIKPPYELKRLLATVTVVDAQRAPGAKPRVVELSTLRAVPRALP